MPFDGACYQTVVRVKPSSATLVLERALALVELGWAQGTGARTYFGIPVGRYSWWAKRFCASGALDRATYNLWREDFYPGRGMAGIYFCRAIGMTRIEPFNDHVRTSKEDVVAAFKRAIVLSTAH